MIKMETPTKPDFKGAIQVRSGNNFVEKGKISLWKHEDSRYVLRGYVNIDGAKYHVSLEVNKQ